jgi:hypothetical protein
MMELCACTAAGKVRSKAYCQRERSLVWQVLIRATLRAVAEARGVTAVENVQAGVCAPLHNPCTDASLTSV